MGAVTIGSILSDFSREDGPARYRDGEQVTVAGVIATYKTRTTRNNTLMAYVDLEDDTASMELLCFSRVLNEAGVHPGEQRHPGHRKDLRAGREGAAAHGGRHPPLGTWMERSRRMASGCTSACPAGRIPRLRKVKLALSFFQGRARRCSISRTAKAGGHPVPDPSRPGGGPEGTAGRGECGGKIVCAITKCCAGAQHFFFQNGGGVQTGDMI